MFVIVWCFGSANLFVENVTDNIVTTGQPMIFHSKDEVDEFVSDNIELLQDDEYQIKELILIDC